MSKNKKNKKNNIENETYWELGYDQGNDEGTITIEIFDSLTEALIALWGSKEESAFIDQWYLPLSAAGKASRTFEVGQSITKKQLNSIYSIFKSGHSLGNDEGVKTDEAVITLNVTDALADYEQRELATSALDSAINEAASRIDDKHFKEEKEKDLKGLEIAKDLIESDEQAYTEGLYDGKDTVRNELEPIVQALLKEIKERGQTQVGVYSLEHIESTLAL